MIVIRQMPRNGRKLTQKSELDLETKRANRGQNTGLETQARKSSNWNRQFSQKIEIRTLAPDTPPPRADGAPPGDPTVYTAPSGAQPKQKREKKRTPAVGLLTVSKSAQRWSLEAHGTCTCSVRLVAELRS